VTEHLPHIMTKHGSDDFQTPPIALQPLLPYISKDWTIWEPACGKGNLVKELRGRGFGVLASDLYCSFEIGYADFLTEDFSDYDCILTNPPFSKKN